MIEETYPTIPKNVYIGSCIHCNPLLFLEDNTVTETIKNGGGVVECSTGDHIFSNDSNIFLNFDKCTLSTEDNECGNIDTPVTGVTLGYDNIRKLHDISKQHVYGILDF